MARLARVVVPGLPRESVGRPLGNDRFLALIEWLTGRMLKPGKRVPKPSEQVRG
jgi:REP-associated tyrosine transposase